MRMRECIFSFFLSPLPPPLFLSLSLNLSLYFSINRTKSLMNIPRSQKQKQNVN